MWKIECLYKILVLIFVLGTFNFFMKNIISLFNVGFPRDITYRWKYEILEQTQFSTLLNFFSKCACFIWKYFKKKSIYFFFGSHGLK